VTRSQKLPRAFFARSTLSVARELIGMRLVHDEGGRRRSGRIVETEAYLGPRDLAAHSARGRTPRTEVMFGAPGHAYVYLVYGVWYCLNVVTRAPGIPQAVLLRALEPLEGIQERTNGPGLLCRALHIDRRHNGIDLTGNVLWLERAAPRGARLAVARSARIGVDYAGEWAGRPWRFFERSSAYVSRPALPKLRAARRTPPKGT
jgi:DNA-3-methyladenine glycosylase